MTAYQRWFSALLGSRTGVLLLGTVVATAAAIALGSGSQAAATCTQTFGPASGAWPVATNWTPNGVPPASDSACTAAAESATPRSSQTGRRARGRGTVTASPR